jgi:hypothetical protein
MVKRQASLLTGGLALGMAVGLVMVVFGSLTLAQEPVSQGDSDVHMCSIARYVERQELIGLTAGQVVSHAVRIEPVQFQVAERTIAEAWISPIKLLSEVRLAERHHAFQPLRSEFEALAGRVVSEASPIPSPVPTRGLVRHTTRAAVECVVVSTADSGVGTLRRCLEDAVVGDTITFDTDVFPPTSPVTIPLSSALPSIITDSLTVDASDAGVILDGSGLSSGDGFTVVGADNVSIRGLQILRFPRCGVTVMAGGTNTTIGGDRLTGRGPFGQGNRISGNGRMGVWIQDSGTMSITVLGNYIGTDLSGTSALGNGEVGVFIGFGARNNIIGGQTSGTGNLISGNGSTGVFIQNTSTAGNRVLGNYIGTDIFGTSRLENAQVGVFVGFGATNNTIGGSTPEMRNLISGNSGDGVFIQNTGTAGNRVIGNYIGTDASGMASLGNRGLGVFISAGASNNTIGGDARGARNLISGNGDYGVFMGGSGTSGNRVSGNFIGTNVSGTAALGNAIGGVTIYWGATDNVIGGDTPGAGNLISGNEYDGVFIQGSGAVRNQVIGNRIGTAVAGTALLGNRNGVVIGFGAAHNMIGGDTSEKRNLISGNKGAGVWIQNRGTLGNQVLGNYIGTDVAGTTPLGNGSFGVLIGFEATNNVIGGIASEVRNVISDNGEAGVWIQNIGTMGNAVLGNYIGTDASGAAALGNRYEGVLIAGGATSNTIGGDVPGARNLISGNGKSGVQIQDAGTTYNTVRGNHIGTDVSGKVALANVRHGVAILDGATGNVVGGAVPQARNLISGNGLAGVLLYDLDDQGTSENQIVGNYIGTDVSGTASLPNSWGVFIGEGAANNTVGGTVSGTRNLISGNGETGVRIEDSETMSNTVIGNYIGTNVSGTVSLPNEYGVVVGFGTTNNTIGGCTSEAGNLISGNRLAGVVIWDAGDTSGNQVLGNYIGTDVSGTASLSNRWGVYIASGATNNVIGGDPGVGNLISGNGESGVWIQDAGTSANQVPGNFIGANAGYGVFIGSGATRNTIGVSNTIVYNALAGVVISGTNTLSNTVTRNVIHHNGGLPIDLVAWPVPVLPPTLDDFSCLDNTVWGTSCPGCRVEVFANPTTTPAGTVFAGDVVAVASGHFSLTMTGLPLYQYLAATATDPDGTTSQFSGGFLLAGGALTPTSITITVSSSATVIYTHTLTNVGQCTDAITLSAASELGWLETYQPLQVTLDRGMTATVTVTITVPDGLTKRAIDKTVVTATSGLIPCAIATAEDIVVFEFKIHLPLVIRDYEEPG